MPPLDESESVRSETPRRKRRRRRRRPVTSAPPTYRGSDSAEAARYTRSRDYHRRRPSAPSRGADSAEAARQRIFDTLNRLELRRTHRDIGGRVINRPDLGELLASVRERRERGEFAGREEVRRGTPLSEAEEEKNRAKVLADAITRTLGPDLERSREAQKLGFGLAAKQTGEGIINIPAGVYEMGKAAGFDVRDIATGRDFTPSRSRDLAEAIAEQTAYAFKHPNERPGDVLLTLFAFGSGGAGAGSRLSAASRASRAARAEAAAARETSGVRFNPERSRFEGGSVLRAPEREIDRWMAAGPGVAPSGAILAARDILPGVRPALSALVRRPPAGRVEIAPGVYRNLSRNRLAALYQRRRIRQQEKHPEGLAAVGMPRQLRGRNRAESIGRERAQQERILADVERAPAEALRAEGRRSTRAEQTAVRAVGERTTLATRIAKHQADLDAMEGNRPTARLARRRLRDKIALLREVQREGYVLDGPEPTFPPGSKLERLYQRAVASTGRREEILEELGLASRAQLEARRAAPARVFQGAKYERQKAVKAVKAHVREYQLPGTQVRRPRTEAEAKERLAVLDKMYDDTVGGIMDTLSGGVHDVGEQARRNLSNLKRGKNKYRGLKKLPTVKQELRAMAEEELARLLEARKADPEIARVAELVDERDRLRAAVSEKAFERLGPEPAPAAKLDDMAEPAEFGTVTATVPGKTIRRKVAGREAKPAYERLVGFEETPAGELYIPYGRRRIKISRGQAGTPKAQGVPRPPASVTQRFTGKSIETGRFRDDAVTAIAEAELEMVQHRSILRVREAAERESISAEELLALPPRERAHHKPVRIELYRRRGKKGKASGETLSADAYKRLSKQEQRRWAKVGPFSPDTRDFLETIEGKLADGVRLTRQEKRELGRRGDEIRAWAFPDMSTQQALAAATRGEVRFVDRRRLGGLDEPHQLAGGKFQPLANLADELNSAQQIAILFLKPAYLTPNLIGQAALTLIQQGAVAPWNMAHAVKIYRALDEADRAAIRGGIGQGFARSLSPEGGRVFRHARDTMAHAYSKVLDSPFRWPAFIHEARMLGYDTPAKVRQLVRDKSKQADMLEAFKRTREAMIDYADLTPWEQRLVRRVIFFYPWVKGSTVYTARFTRDHPIVASAMLEAGRVAGEKQERELGRLPWFMRGVFKVGGSRERPLVVNPQAAQLFGSPVQAGEAVGNLLSGKPREAGYRLGDLLSPAAQLPFQLERPHDPLYGYDLPLSEALKRQYVTNLPQARLARELREPTEDREDVLYPTSRRGALAKFGVGTIFPRPVNLSEARERVEEEERAGLGPAEKAARDVFQERTSLWKAAKEYAPEQLENGRLPADLREAFNRKAATESLRRRLEDEYPEPGVERELAKLQAEARLLVGWGAASPQEAATTLRWARTATLSELRSKRASISARRFGSAYADRIAKARKFLEELGANLDAY